jgi:hypothetical protein
MRWYSEYKTPLVAIGTFWFVRLRQLYISLTAVAAVIVIHTDLLHFGEFWNDLIVLVCLVLLTLNHSVLEKQ